MDDTKLCRIVGSVAISIVGFQLVRKLLPWLYFNVIGPHLLGPKIDVRRMGAWAVITGATDGIGKAYAKALAKKGLNLVLISRTRAKLESVSKELVEAYSIETKIIDVDFTAGPEIYEKINVNIQSLEIGVLVNNIGISYPHPEFFLETYERNPQFLREIVRANIHSVTHMSALVLPMMVKNLKGVIINVSSTSGVIPNPLLAVYSATKAFVTKFSADLHTEYNSKGITVQCVEPGFVATNMSKIRKTSLFAPSADIYVESALRSLGIANETAGYLPHSLMQLVIHSINAILGEDVARKIVFKNLLGMRSKALRNLNKQK